MPWVVGLLTSTTPGVGSVVYAVIGDVVCVEHFWLNRVRFSGFLLGVVVFVGLGLSLLS